MFGFRPKEKHSSVPIGTSLDKTRACSVCKKKQIPGQPFFVVSAVGGKGDRPICGSCFTCSHCQKDLSSASDEPFHTHAETGKLYCDADYLKYLAKKCEGCKKSLTSGQGVVTVRLAGAKPSEPSKHKHHHRHHTLEKEGASSSSVVFHPECFKCAACHKPIKGSYRVNEAFGNGDGGPNNKGLSIAGAGAGGGGKSVAVSDQGRGGEGKGFGAKKVSYYCSKDYDKLFGARCAGKSCGKPIGSGEAFFELLDKKFHADLGGKSCFCCGLCSKDLIKNKYHVDKDNKDPEPVCEACYVELKAPRCDRCAKAMQSWVQVGGHTMCKPCLKAGGHCFSCKALVLTPLPPATTTSGSTGSSKLVVPPPSVPPSLPPLSQPGGKQVRSGELEELRDGRSICAHCSATAVRTQGQVLALLDEVKLVLSSHGLVCFGKCDTNTDEQQRQLCAVMANLSVDLVGLQELRKQVRGFCKNASPLGVTLSSTELRKTRLREKSFVLPPTKEDDKHKSTHKSANHKSKRQVRTETAVVSEEDQEQTPSKSADRGSSGALSSGGSSSSGGKRSASNPGSSRASSRASSSRASSRDEQRGDEGHSGSGGGVDSVGGEGPLKMRLGPTRRASFRITRTEVETEAKNAAGAGVKQRQEILTTTTVTETVLSVKGIKVVNCLPRTQCGAVIAHELCHSFMTLTGFAGGSSSGLGGSQKVVNAKNGLLAKDLDSKVVEGLCELFAHLWLKSVRNSSAAAAAASSLPSSSSSSPFKRGDKGESPVGKHRTNATTGAAAALASSSAAAAAAAAAAAPKESQTAAGSDAQVFLDLQKNNEDPVYGGGFRLALQAFESDGVAGNLPLLLSLVKERRGLPR